MLPFNRMTLVHVLLLLTARVLFIVPIAQLLAVVSRPWTTHILELPLSHEMLQLARTPFIVLFTRLQVMMLMLLMRIPFFQDTFGAQQRP